MKNNDRIGMINDMNNRNGDKVSNYSRVQSGKELKPPTSQSSILQQTPQMLRESREKQRHQHLANVSKQIVSPDSHQQSDVGGGGYAVIHKPSHAGIGLPPTGSPSKKKGKMNNREEEVMARVRAPLNIPKQPIKPSNYGTANARHQSMNKVAPKSKGLQNFHGSKLSRDRSSDGLMGQQSSPPLLNQQYSAEDPNNNQN